MKLLNSSKTRVLITGGNGFLGKHVCPKFNEHRKADGEFEPWTFSSQQYDLTNLGSTMELFEQIRPHVVVHMAATCGGIGANKKWPADFIHDNLKMTSNVFDAVRHYNIEYVYTLGSVCAYPKFCPAPFKEDDLFNGYPEETNAPYGISKRVQLMMQKTYRQQYGIKGAHLIPVNMYGPHNHFDLENSHVIPALINKFINAKRNGLSEVPVWGTGEATREFLYAGDCADAIFKAVTTRLDYDEPINIGTGKDISIKDLAYLLAELVGFGGNIVFSGDVSINGQPKRQLDISRAKEVLSFAAQTDLRTGLLQTIQWYEKEVLDGAK